MRTTAHLQYRKDRRVLPIAQRVANWIAQTPRPGRLHFDRIVEPDQWNALCRMRLRVYREALPYLLDELDEHGLDPYDEGSFVFGAWWEGDLVATIRATPCPYETLRYISTPELVGYLGPGWDTDYLEWGRLVVDTARGVNRIAPALITYAGLWILMCTPYRKYFGYMRRHTRRLLHHFRFLDDRLCFRIPTRGSHEYVIVKGEFGRDLLSAIPRWVSAVSRRLLAGSFRPIRARSLDVRDSRAKHPERTGNVS